MERSAASRFTGLVRLGTLISSLLGSRTGAQGPARMVADLAPPEPCNLVSGTRHGVSARGLVFYRSNNGLWRTDGTAAGTVLLKDVTSLNSPEGSGESNGLYYCFASSAVANGMWVSDGTPAGTRSLAAGFTGVDLFQAPGSAGNLTLFTASTNATGRELWRTDGTSQGTALVKDIWPGTGSGPVQGTAFVRSGSRAFFVAEDGVHGAELWITDATAAGTALVADIRPGPASAGIVLLGEWNGRVLFGADDGTSGQELWQSDGTTAGTQQVREIGPGGLGASLRKLGATANGLCFWADDGVHGLEPWVSDGTVAGTVLLRDILPGAQASLFPPTGTSEAAPLNGLLLFPAMDGVNGGELWRTDGTPGGTVLVRDLQSGPTSSMGGHLIAGGGRVWFDADDGTTGLELWQSDGTAAGTALVHDVNPGPTPSLPLFLGVTNGKLIFVADDGVHGRETWKSDGTAAGTVFFHDATPCPGDLVASLMGDARGTSTLFFTTYERSWRSDGTATGTQSFFSMPSSGNFVPLGSEILFSTYGPANFWATDGTAAGTRMLPCGCQMLPAATASVVTGGTLYFAAGDASLVPALWRSDGTAGGTVRLGLQFVDNLVAFQGRVFGTASDGVHGSELCVSDGTPGGTRMVVDLYPGGQGSGPAALTVGEGGIYFSAGGPTGGRKLWFSDGTAAGTRVVRELNPGGDAQPNGLLFHRGLLWFAADDGVNGMELWTSDGTAAGTVLVKDISPGSGGSGPFGLVAFGDGILFGADGGTTGRELWKSDGTAAGTVLVREIQPGTQGSLEGRILALPGARHALFAARHEDTGRELWITDGTPAGTTLLQDVAPGALSSELTALTLVGNQVLFRANDGVHGQELWVMPAVAHAGPYGAGCANGRVPRIRGVGDAPFPGNAGFGVQLQAAQPGAAAVLLVGTRRAELQLGSGCALAVDGLVLALPATADPAGTATQPLPVPNDLALRGGRLTGQWAAAEPGGPVLGQLALSSGLSIVIGD